MLPESRGEKCVKLPNEHNHNKVEIDSKLVVKEDNYDIVQGKKFLFLFSVKPIKKKSF